jgi:hypothetical protein
MTFRSCSRRARCVSLRTVLSIGILAAAVLAAPVASFVQAGAGMRYVRAPYPGVGTAPAMEDAISATWCESRGRASPRDGQYKGHFQIGRSEWQKFGNGDPYNAVSNSAAAYRYYAAVGSWRPWQCQP